MKHGLLKAKWLFVAFAAMGMCQLASPAVFQRSQVSTGTIEGIVTQSGTSFPIAGVEIKASTPGLNSSNTYAFGETVSDGAGAFLFREVPPGPYVIEVSKEGYVFGSLPAFNAKATMRITVNAGQRARLPVMGVRASVIRGRVLDAEGRGLPDMRVEILQSTKNAQGQPVWRGLVGSEIRTNDQGEYEKLPLGPGQYVVRTSLERPDSPRVLIYSPGTTDATTAVLMDLRDGSEATADIRIGPSIDKGTYKISGKVTAPAGERTENVSLILRRRPAESDPLFALEGEPRTYTDADSRTGKYEFLGARPGIYDLYAVAVLGGQDYLSKTVVEVRNVDVEDMDLVLRPGMEVKGRLVIEGNPRDLQFRRPLADELRDPNRSRVGDVAISIRRTDGLMNEGMFKASIGDDGVSFAFPKVPIGDYAFNVSFVADGKAPSPALYVADIRAGGRSVIDTGFQVGTDAVDAMEVIVGTDGGSITGIVVGRPMNAAAFLVLLPPAIPEGIELYNAVPIAVNGNNQFEFQGLRPGTYKVFVMQANSDLVPVNTTGRVQVSLPPEFFSRNAANAVNVIVQRGIATTGVRVPFPSNR